MGLLLFIAIRFFFALGFHVRSIEQKQAIKSQETAAQPSTPIPSGQDDTNLVSYFRFVDDYHGRPTIVGKVSMGEKVVLLDKSSSAYCTAISTPTVDLSEAVVWEEVERTGLSKLEQCGVAGRYHIAIIGKEAKDYGIVTLKAVSDDTLIAATDREIKILPTLDSLKQRTQGSGSEVDRCASITNLKPTLYSLEVHGQTMLLAAYSTKRDNRVVAGPSFIVMNNRVYPLTGWCSYPYFRAFTLEGEHYIESGSHCCDCGITVMELFQITQDGPKMVWEDSSFSS